MDTAFDFIQPEFLNILFFQQKSIVIFPYVDVKHLRSLEIFAIGYNIVDLDSTALHNIKEVLELEKYNSYSQNPSFFFITSVNEVQLEEIMSLNGVHCVINCNEDLSSFTNGNNFIFYNKKNKKFLNFTLEDLELEKSLISSSKNISILQDKILKIRTIATNIYTELNDSGNIRAISRILAEIDSNHWGKILEYTKLFYKIEVPDISHGTYSSPRKENGLDISQFSDEYDLIVSKNKIIGKEFMQLIHDYRKAKVNSANLSTEQLYYPLKLYDYLRKNHWSKGIDEEFLTEWVQMNKTNYILNDADLADFQFILGKLKVPNNVILEILDVDLSKGHDDKGPIDVGNSKTSATRLIEVEKVIKDDQKSRLEKLTEIEDIIDNLSDKDSAYLLREITELQILLGNSPEKLVSDVLNLERIPNEIIKTALKTAELDFQTKKAQPKMDATPVIVQYNKGLEIILKMKLSSHFNPLIHQYRKMSSNNQTSREFEKKFGGFVRKKRTITTGKWIHILRDLDNPHNPSDVQEFLDVLRDTFEHPTLKMIKEACDIIVPLRRAVHQDVIISFEEILPIIPRFVSLLNRVINKLF